MCSNAYLSDLLQRAEVGGVLQEGEHAIAKVQDLLDVRDSLLFVKITIGYY